MTSERLDDIFTEVREGLVPLISNIKNEGTPPDNSLLKGKALMLRNKLNYAIQSRLTWDLISKVVVLTHSPSLGFDLLMSE